jgi:hypothetical protein
MHTLDRIEQALNIKLEYIEGRNRQSLSITNCTLTIEHIKQAVAEGKIEWQDANDPHCGNKGNMIYLYLPADTQLNDGEVFIGITLEDAYLTYC